MGRHLPAILGLLALLGHGSSDQGRCLLASDIQELLHVHFLQQPCLGLRLRAVQTMGASKKFMLEKFMYVFWPLLLAPKYSHAGFKFASMTCYLTFMREALADNKNLLYFWVKIQLPEKLVTLINFG